MSPSSTTNMLSTEPPTAYVRKSAQLCGKARNARNNDAQRRKRARQKQYWLKFEHHPTGHVLHGLQRITNILSTRQLTDNVGKNTRREVQLVEKIHKNP
jgi:hypothetical protein